MPDVLDPATLEAALRGALAEWDKFARYGSPIARAANERINTARTALAGDAP